MTGKGGKKGGKKTKAELEEERLQQEEEARKAKILEDKRAAEDAEKQRLENIRIQNERKAFREAEVARLAEEGTQLTELLEERSRKTTTEESIEAANEEWAKFRDPKETVDARNPRDLNTFLSLTAESSSRALPEVLDLSRQLIEVARTVDDVWVDLFAAGKLREQVQASRNIALCVKLLREKLDVATADVLKYADEKLNDKAEFNLEESIDGLSFGMWASYSETRPIRRSIQFDKVGVQIDIPKQILAQDTWFVHRITRLSVESTLYDSYEMHDLAAAMAASPRYLIGDLMMIDILIPPPAAVSIRAKKWSIRDVSSRSMNVQYSPYPSSVACRVYIKIPDEIVMSDDVTIACWDEEKRDWTDTGIAEFQFSEQTRTCQFQLTTTGIFGLVRDRKLDLPFRKWSLAPVRELGNEWYERQARFTVQTDKVELTMDVIGSQVKLLRPVSKQFSDLIGVPYSPGQLLRRLQRRGVNIMPRSADIEHVLSRVEVPSKDESLENAVYADIARWASSYDFMGCPEWNRALDPSKIGVLVRESSVYTGGIDTFDFDCVLAEVDALSKSSVEAPGAGALPPPGVKFTNVRGNDCGDSKTFSDAPRFGEISHLSIRRAMGSTQTEAADERAVRTSGRFERTVFLLLKLTRCINITL